MDNPQHYQPLSHALNPPQAQVQTAYTSSGMYQKSTTAQNTQREEEEEEEEEDGDDEGLVEEQLNADTQVSNPSSPHPKPTSTTDTQARQTQQQTSQLEDLNSQKRRPGRPRGSKNRKPRVGPNSRQETTFYNTTSGASPPQHPDVNPHNQQYYEFQWRVLNLCSEFYTAAEELVKATQPLVIAQCYQMGPGNKVDPLAMLGEAKRICDTLVSLNLAPVEMVFDANPKLSNPSQLVTSPPPPIYSVTPTVYQPQSMSSTSAPSHTTASSSKTTTPSTVISNPGTFVMPLPTAQTPYPHTQYQMYATPNQYPTTSYYQYHQYVPPGTYYSQSQSQTQPATQTATQLHATPTVQPETSTGTAPVTASVISSNPSAAGNQGAWSEEETERLRKLAEDSKQVGQGGDIEWDWVVHQWGNTRTRHQILIKATALGLKESSTRGVKRRRENDGGSDSNSTSVPATPSVNATANASTVSPSAIPTTNHTSATSAPTSNPATASPSHSQAASTPTASPALQNQQRPPPKSAPGLPWPMPTVAVNTPSPVVATSTPTGQDGQRTTSYYRARPAQESSSSSKPSTKTTFIYQPNGSAGSSRLGKENGK